METISQRYSTQEKKLQSNSLVQSNNSLVEFNPANVNQEGFFNSLKNFILFSGAVRAGKSYAGCWKGLFLNYMYPGNKGLICRKTNTALKASTYLTLKSLLPASFIVKENKTDGIIVHKTRIPGVYSTIVFSGLDKNADDSYPVKIGSTEFGWIFVDEITEISREDFDMLMTRPNRKIPGLSNEQNNIIPRPVFGATNPEGPYHWCYQFFIDEPGKDPSLHADRDVFFTTPYENAHNLPTGYIEKLERNLTGFIKDRLLYGKWVQAEGVIYKDFTPQHVIKDDVLPPNVEFYKDLFFAGDSNYPLPRCSVLIGLYNDKFIILEEFHKEEGSTPDQIEWCLTMANKYKRNLSGYHDPSDPETIAMIKRTPRLSCVKAVNSVTPGISTVASYLKTTSLLVHERCVHTIKEFNSYRYKKGSKEVPEKKDDHLMDCVRYGMHTYRPRANMVMGGFL